MLMTNGGKGLSARHYWIVVGFMYIELSGNALTHVFRSCVATMLHMDCALPRGGGG